MKKRLIAMLVMTMLVMTSFCAPYEVAMAKVEQAGNIKLLHDINTVISGYSLGRCVKSTEYGVRGMGADVPVARFTASDDCNENNWYAYKTWTDSKFGNYLVIEADLLFDEHVTTFNIGTNQHNTVSAQIKVNSECVPYQWGKFVMIFNIAENTTSTYYNGYLVSENLTTNFNTVINGTKYNAVRLIFGGPKVGSAWVANYKMYEAINAPEINSELYIEGFKESARVVTKVGDTFNSALTASIEDAKVKIFTDDSYTTTVSTDDVLFEGYMIWLESEFEYRIYTVDVDDGIKTEDEICDGDITFQRATAETVMGMFGKSADDISQKIVSDSALAAFSTYTWLNDDFEGYVRADFNIEPGNAKEIYIGTNVHKPVSEALTLNANQWNRVTVVYSTDDYNHETGYGKAVTYVNGVEYSTVDTIFTHLGQMRVVIKGEAGSYIYIDDFSFTTFAYGRASIDRPVELSDDFEIINGYVMPEEGMTAGDLYAKDTFSVIRVFENSLCENELEADDELGLGNVVVVETKNKVYNYYTAHGIANTNVLSNIDDGSDKFTVSRGETSVVKGFGGKAANDESIKITVTADDNGNFNAYNDYTWKNEGYKGFVAIEVNVYPVSAKITLATNGHSAISSPITNLVKNRWNKVSLFYDAASYNGSKGKTYLYVNGSYVGQYDANFTSGKVVRLIINSEEGIGGYLYVDDYRIYESDILPVVSVPDISKYYVVNGSDVSLEDDLVPSALSAGKLALRVFENDTFARQLEDNEAIRDGNVLVAEDGSKTLSYYYVNNNVEKNILAAVSDVSSISEKIQFVDAAVSGAKGVHGRESDDESICLQLTNSSTKNAYFRYEYDLISDYRYIVTEVAVYTEVDAEYKFGTNGHVPISGKIVAEDETTYKNQWTKLVHIFDKKDFTGYLYANGELVNKTVNEAFLTNAYKSLRFICSSAVGNKVYLDDIGIYECNIKPSVAKPAVIPASVSYILFNSDLYLPSEVRRSQLESILEIDDAETEIKFFRDGAVIEPAQDDALPDNTFMTLKRRNGLYTAYNVHITEKNKAFFYGDMGKAGALSNGVLKIAVPIENVSDQPMVVIAGYKNGELVRVEKAVAENYTKHITYDLDVKSDEYDSVKVMVWNSANMMPYSKNAQMNK